MVVLEKMWKAESERADIKKNFLMKQTKIKNKKNFEIEKIIKIRKKTKKNYLRSLEKKKKKKKRGGMEV